MTMSRITSFAFLALMLWLQTPTTTFANDYLCRTVGPDWTWFGDHATSTIDYGIVGEPDRTFEVGTGMFIAGSPWGWRSTHSSVAEVTAWGVGALHLRHKDSGSPIKICVTIQRLGTIEIIRREF